ncbi:MAG: glycosyltransferase [Acidimicrobiia bacterium]
MKEQPIWKRSHRIYEDNKVIHQTLFKNIFNHIVYLLFRVNRKFFWKEKKFSVVSQSNSKIFPLEHLSIVIPVFGSSPTLLKCLDSISDSEGIVPEVIIIDNGSPDHLAKNILKHELKIKYIKNDINKGFGDACDTGIKNSTNEIILLLNSDVIVRNDCIAILVNELKNDESIGCCSPVLINRYDRIEEAGRVLTSNGDAFPILAGTRSNKVPEYGRWSVPYASFACTLMRKSVYKQTKGFDPAYNPAYSEDIDLSLQISNIGFKNFVLFGARAFHVQGESSEQLLDLQDIKNRNMKYLSEKYREYFIKLPNKIEFRKFPFDLQASWHQHASSRSLYILDSDFDFRQYFDDYKNINLDEFVQVISVKSSNSKLTEFSAEEVTFFQQRNISCLHHGIANLEDYIRNYVGIFEFVYMSKEFDSKVGQSIYKKFKASQSGARFIEIFN